MSVSSPPSHKLLHHGGVAIEPWMRIQTLPSPPSLCLHPPLNKQPCCLLHRYTDNINNEWVGLSALWKVHSGFMPHTSLVPGFFLECGQPLSLQVWTLQMALVISGHTQL